MCSCEVLSLGRYGRSCVVLEGLSLGFGGEEVEANGMRRAVQRSPRLVRTEKRD